MNRRFSLAALLLALVAGSLHALGAGAGRNPWAYGWRKILPLGGLCSAFFLGVPLLRPPGARALWLLALLGMASTGAVQMRQGIAGMAPNRSSADATSEAIFASLTNEREVPRRLVAAMAALPDARPLLILRPPNDVLTALPAYMVAYQAMPRRAMIREARLEDSAAAVAEVRKSFSAAIFVGQEPPPAFPSGERFGRSFVFVPLHAAP